DSALPLEVHFASSMCFRVRVSRCTAVSIHCVKQRRKKKRRVMVHPLRMQMMLHTAGTCMGRSLAAKRVERRSVEPTCGHASKMRRVAEWTCPRPANTPDVGVSPRGGCSNAEAGGGGPGNESPITAIVHAVVQGRGRGLGATG